MHPFFVHVFVSFMLLLMSEGAKQRGPQPGLKSAFSMTFPPRVNDCIMKIGTLKIKTKAEKDFLAEVLGNPSRYMDDSVELKGTPCDNNQDSPTIQPMPQSKMAELIIVNSTKLSHSDLAHPHPSIDSLRVEPIQGYGCVIVPMIYVYIVIFTTLWCHLLLFYLLIDNYQLRSEISNYLDDDKLDRSK